MIGQTLGHYLILEKIGAGGMGVVYRARDERLERDVAVKLLPPGSLSAEASRKRFRKEALALSKLFTWCFITVVADGKMRAIFSLTFGASVYLLIDRLCRKGAAADAADIHYRRMLWLLLFGMIHAYLIWLGDILFYYAMLGLLLYPLRKLSPRALLITAGIRVLVMSGEGIRNHFHLEGQHRDYVQIQAEEKAGIKLTKDQEETRAYFKTGYRVVILQWLFLSI
jgi:uncharacterized membrane protein YeiB